MSRDTIGDFLTVIRNGVMVSKPSVTFPYSNLCYQIAEILKSEGFIRNVTIESNTDSEVKKYPLKRLKIVLKYVDRESVIHEITRKSTPGRRLYMGANDLKPVIGGLGITILTTNQGVIANKKAKSLKVGGEVICTVW
ncbi:MAG TPA: 30S ribosomal protein S8 [Candidatus Babeliales bacterium]|nr:30S ribosomal protein S8 [Candidatus Babeliales bacterium]